jgi:adenylate cyclase class 2
MMELEIKVPCEDLEDLERRLKSMGASHVEDLDQVDLYFSHPCRDFGVTDEALRLRRENERTVITYKGPKLDKDTKLREEIELGVEDIDRMSMMLERLGFLPVIRIAKQRTVYDLQGIHFCLDRLPGLGNFVEMEWQGDDLDAGKQKIMELKQKLGLAGNERRSYLELLIEKR